MRLPPLPTIGDVVRLYKLSAAKRLSQNFIMDMSLNHKIVSYAGNLNNSYVCEVGPGPGGITRAILEQNVKHLYVIEKDRRFFPGLQMLADASGRLTAYHGDVLNFNMDHLFPEDCLKEWMDEPPDTHIIGNLPFSVATPLIFQYMEAISMRTGAWRYGRTKMTLTFQREVAERMVAAPKSEHRARLSVDIQNLCHVKLKMVIPGRAFVPPPDVDVGVVSFIPRKIPKIDLPFQLIVKLNRHLFHYRQKMCKNSLVTLFPPDQPELLAELIEDAKVNPEKTPIALGMSEIGRLCQVYDRICKRLPYIYNYDYRQQRSRKEYERICQIDNELKMGNNKPSQSNESDSDDDVISTENVKISR